MRSFRLFLGFLLPTALITVGLHLESLATLGEAADGLVSGTYFSAMFGMGSYLAGRRLRSEVVAESSTRDLVTGVAAALATWGLLAAFWNVTGLRAPILDTYAFVLNSAIMLGSGIATVALLHRVLAPAHPKP